MDRRKNKYIPDKEFHKLWDSAYTAIDLKDYIQKEKDLYNYKKYNLEYDEMLEFLKSIYNYSHKSLKDILSQNTISKSQISHRLCIPIRTVEDWVKYEKEPSYIKLWILTEWDLLNFKRIKREKEEKKNFTKNSHDSKKIQSLENILKEYDQNFILQRTAYLDTILNRKTMQKN